MKIVVSALHFTWRDMEHCLARAREELGLDGVELSWHGRFVRPSCTHADLDALKQLGPPSGLHLAAHIWEDLAELGPGPGGKALLHWLELCAETGVTDLVIHGGAYPEQREGIQRVRGVLAAVAGQFEKAGVVLNLENHYAYDFRRCNELFSEPWEFLEVFSLDSPALRFCFDTGHAHMTHNADALLLELAPWLRHVHLADNHGLEDDHCAFREGTVPWDDIFNTLERIAFDGTFCVEFPVRDNLEPFEACVSELRQRFGQGA